MGEIIRMKNKFQSNIPNEEPESKTQNNNSSYDNVNKNDEGNNKKLRAYDMIFGRNNDEKKIVDENNVWNKLYKQGKSRKFVDESLDANDNSIINDNEIKIEKKSNINISDLKGSKSIDSKNKNNKKELKYKRDNDRKFYVQVKRQKINMKKTK